MALSPKAKRRLEVALARTEEANEVINAIDSASGGGGGGGGSVEASQAVDVVMASNQTGVDYKALFSKVGDHVTFHLVFKNNNNWQPDGQSSGTHLLRFVSGIPEEYRPQSNGNGLCFPVLITGDADDSLGERGLTALMYVSDSGDIEIAATLENTGFLYGSRIRMIADIVVSWSTTPYNL